MVNLPFLKKKQTGTVHGKGFTPTDRVRELAGRGFSEPEMIDVLRRESFSPEEIDNALTTALAVTAGGPSNVPKEFNPPEPTSQKPEKPEQQEQLPTIEQLAPQPQMPQVPETSLPEQYYQQSYPSEEYVDAVVSARVQEVDDRLADVLRRNQELTKTVSALQEKLDQVAKGHGGEQQQILSKIDNFDDSLADVSTRLGGLEKAFKETLPALIESVRSLSDIVQMLKREG